MTAPFKLRDLNGGVLLMWTADVGGKTMKPISLK